MVKFNYPCTLIEIYSVYCTDFFCRTRAQDVFRLTLESDMAVKEVWINSVSENHEVAATIMWTRTDVEGNRRVDLLQVGLA